MVLCQLYGCKYLYIIVIPLALCAKLNRCLVTSFQIVSLNKHTQNTYNKQLTTGAKNINAPILISYYNYTLFVLCIKFQFVTCYYLC